jgi:hypothetical protein
MVLAAVGAGSFALMARGAGISVDFYGTGGGGGTLQSQMGPSETAGVVPLGNWNSFAPVGQATGGTPGSQATPQPLVDDTGAATGASVVWTSNNTWNTPITEAPGDFRMMKGYIDTNDTSITSVNVTGLPAALTAQPYAVILYYDGDNGTQTRVGKYSIDADAGDATFWGRDAASSSFNGAYVLGATPIDPLPGATGTGLDSQGTAAAAVPAGNYLIFPDVMGSSFTISAQASVSSGTTNRAAIQGIQIVPMSAVPEPGTMALVGLMAIGLVSRRRRG